MRKGFFFTVDALLGIGVIITLLGAITIIGMAEQKSGEEMALLHTVAADEAQSLALKGSKQQDNIPIATTITAACVEIFDYDLQSGTITLKVRKCKTFG